MSRIGVFGRSLLGKTAAALAFAASFFGRKSAAVASTSPDVKRLEEHAAKPRCPVFFRTDPDSRSFGMSRTCARMVRKNRLRRLGVAGSRI